MILLLHPELPPETRAQLAQCLRREGLDSAETLAMLDGGGRVLELPEQSAPRPDLVSRAKIWPGVRQVLSSGEALPRVAAARLPVEVPSLRPSARAFTLGRDRFCVAAGPCAVDEDPAVLVACARAVVAAGATILRAGAFKPRTSPYSFQGLGRDGLLLLSRVASDHGVPVVTEVFDPRDVDFVAQHAEVLQIGARNMQNFALLQEVGKAGRPVLLKRGPAATVEEWLAAAEYCLLAGAPTVALCERGVRGFDSTRRNLLDLSVVPALRARCELPIFVDPSHATGVRRYVPSMACAAVAAGADAVMVEIHPRAQHAPSDPAQALALDELAPLVDKLREYAELEGRTLVSARCERNLAADGDVPRARESSPGHKSNGGCVDETRNPDPRGGVSRAVHDIGPSRTS